MKTHYEEFGFAEQRSIDSFDELSYVAIHSDLMNAFGSNMSTLEERALKHYISFGSNEPRNTSGDITAYINENGLSDQFSEDPDSVKRQYISDFIGN